MCPCQARRFREQKVFTRGVSNLNPGDKYDCFGVLSIILVIDGVVIAMPI